VLLPSAQQRRGSGSTEPSEQHRDTAGVSACAEGRRLAHYQFFLPRMKNELPSGMGTIFSFGPENSGFRGATPAARGGEQSDKRTTGLQTHSAVRQLFSSPPPTHPPDPRWPATPRSPANHRHRSGETQKHSHRSFCVEFHCYVFRTKSSVTTHRSVLLLFFLPLYLRPPSPRLRPTRLPPLSSPWEGNASVTVETVRWTTHDHNP